MINIVKIGSTFSNPLYRGNRKLGWLRYRVIDLKDAFG